MKCMQPLGHVHVMERHPTGDAQIVQVATPVPLVLMPVGAAPHLRRLGQELVVPELHRRTHQRRREAPGPHAGTGPGRTPGTGSVGLACTSLNSRRSLGVPFSHAQSIGHGLLVGQDLLTTRHQPLRGRRGPPHRPPRSSHAPQRRQHNRLRLLGYAIGRPPSHPRPVHPRLSNNEIDFETPLDALELGDRMEHLDVGSANLWRLADGETARSARRTSPASGVPAAWPPKERAPVRRRSRAGLEDLALRDIIAPGAETSSSPTSPDRERSNTSGSPPRATGATKCCACIGTTTRSRPSSVRSAISSASAGGKYAHIYSLAVCVNPGSVFNCYWEMPFSSCAPDPGHQRGRRATHALLPDRLHVVRCP